MTDVRAVECEIARIFMEQIHLEIPSADVDLFETAALDSMAFVELLAALEERFGLRIPLDRLGLDDFRTIGKIARLVAGGNGGSPRET
ncbi:MAG: phosphopantetheine-binding protein [Candidatus Polarisedimenticolia bacterium]